MTSERIQRGDDEKLYQPRIHSRWIRELYRLKVDTGDPMTVLIDQALSQFVERRRNEQHDGPAEVGCATSDGPGG